MSEVTILCAPADKEDLEKLMNLNWEDDAKDYAAEVEWSTEDGHFYHSHSCDTEFNSHYYEIEQMMEGNDPVPPFMAQCASTYSYVAINIGGFFRFFDTDAAFNPVVVVKSLVEGGCVDYDAFAEALLFYEVKQEFEIYMQMRG